MSAYENQRVHFDKILQKYNAYVELYRFFNNGSVKGRTPFADFYFLHTYYQKVADMTARYDTD